MRDYDNDTQRIIGALVEFKEQTHAEFLEIKKEIRQLNHFKLKVIGGATTASLIFAVFVKIIEAFKP